jgi:hypothetical protein
MEKQERNDLDTFNEDSIRIDPMDLNRAYCELPGQLAYWNGQLADLTHKAMLAKADHEADRARATLAIREADRLDKGKMTVGEVDAKVLLDTEVQDAQMVWIEAEAARLRVRGVVDALLAKRDMIQSLGAKLRAEMWADPVLRDQMAAATAMEFGHRGNHE